MDDVIFECDDARAEVGYQVQLDVDVTSTAPQHANRFYVGDPHGAWGAGSGDWGSWRSDLGGSLLLAGIPPGDGFSERLTGHLRTVPTGVPVSISVSIGAMSWALGAAEEHVIDSHASLPVSGPVFVLPDGCTCSSTEGGIEDNQLLEPVPQQTVSWGTLKGTYD